MGLNPKCDPSSLIWLPTVTDLNPNTTYISKQFAAEGENQY